MELRVPYPCIILVSMFGFTVQVGLIASRSCQYSTPRFDPGEISLLPHQGREVIGMERVSLLTISVLGLKLSYWANAGSGRAILKSHSEALVMGLLIV